MSWMEPMEPMGRTGRRGVGGEYGESGVHIAIRAAQEAYSRRDIFECKSHPARTILNFILSGRGDDDLDSQCWKHNG